MKILFVDQNNLFNLRLRHELEEYSSSLEMMSIQSPEQSLDILDNFRPQLVVVGYTAEHSMLLTHLFSQLKKKQIDFIIVAKDERGDIYQRIIEFDPCGYFCTPVDFMSLKYQINRRIQEKIRAHSSGLKKDKEFFVFKWNSQLRKERFSDINFIHAEGNYITLHLDNKEYLIRYSLKMIEKELPSNQFIRVHRNYVVNLSKIYSIDIAKNLIILNSCQLPIGRKYKRNVKSSFYNSDYISQQSYTSPYRVRV